ncbi:MAG: sporulation protein YqfD, partial [Clostridia bacterium]|nr:sporulation protein YqfD [Clostridia bacterium]
MAKLKSNFLKSLIEIKISGLNQEKVFNKLLEKGIEVFALTRDSRSSAIFSVSPNNLKKTITILNQNQITVKDIKKQGLIKLYSGAISRFGILIGFCLSLILLFISNNFIFSIKIYGTEKIDSKEVIEFLDKNKIGIFTNKAMVKIENLEFLILQNFEDISLVSMIKKGTSLIINIKEKEIKEESKNFHNIISDYNGRILEMNLVSGTSLKKAGDIIRKGDLLVGGYYFDSLGNKNKIKPEADIKVEVWIENKSVHYENVVESEFTGNEIKLRSVSLFGLEIFGSNQENIFEKYEKHEKVKKITNLILPLKIKYITLKEIEMKHKFIPFEDVKDFLIEQSKQNALQKLSEDDIIKDEQISITQFPEFTILSYL